MKKKITSVLIIVLCVLMAVPWGVFAQAVNAEKGAASTQQQTTAPAPTPTPETTAPAAEPTPAPTPEQPAEAPAEPRDESASTLADYPAGRAVLDTGPNVNHAFCKLSGTSINDHYYGTRRGIYNNTIKAILRSDSPAPQGETTKNLSISSVPVTAWWNEQTATIYWYSEDAKPMLNSDSSCIFEGYIELAHLDVSHFDTSKVTNMSFMFYATPCLTDLDLTNFDTSNVTYMSNMFRCKK